MGIKHLFGFILAISGTGVGLLALAFTLNGQTFNKDFLLTLGSLAIVALFAGILILNKR
jgi:hypothetical protein